MIGYAFCGSYCTHKDSLAELDKLIGEGYEIQPIVSENVYSTDTRFGSAKELVGRLSRMCGRDVIHTVVDAEPLGPKEPLDMLVICPCTAFDKTCSRVGMGGGYYDRFLPKCINAAVIAVAFECQKAENIPVQDTDIRMDAVFTEKTVYTAK